MSFDSTATGSSAFIGAPRRHTIKRKPAPQYIESPPSNSPLVWDISLPTTVISSAQDDVQEYRDRALANLEGYRMDGTLRTSAVASPAVSPTTLVAASEGHEITVPSPAMLVGSRSPTSQDCEHPSSGMWPTRRPSTRSTSQGSGYNSRDTSRRPSKSHRLPHRPSVVDVFQPQPTPPQSVHVRSDPAYVSSPVTAEFQYKDLRMPNFPGERLILPDRRAYDLARYESHTSTFVSAHTGNTSILSGSTAAFNPEYGFMPPFEHRPTQGTVGSASSGWRPGNFIARILGDMLRRAEAGEVIIDEAYRDVHERALETEAIERKLAPVAVAMPYLDGHANVPPLAPVEFMTPSNSERENLWKVDAEKGVYAMHAMQRPRKDSWISWTDDVGCFPLFDAFKACFGAAREH